jgi:hypothetical protein
MHPEEKMPDNVKEIHCTVTGKLTASCDQCSLFKSRKEGGDPKCRAKKGERYKMVARPLSGEYWDTYVLTPQEIKDIEAGRSSIGYKTVRAKGGS